MTPKRKPTTPGPSRPPRSKAGRTVYKVPLGDGTFGYYTKGLKGSYVPISDRERERGVERGTIKIEDATERSQVTQNVRARRAKQPSYPRQPAPDPGAGVDPGLGFDPFADGAGSAAASAAAELAQRRSEALGGLVDSLLGRRLGERAANRETQAGLLSSALPQQITPQQAGLLGRVFAGLAGGQPAQTTEVPIDFSALQAADVGGEQAAAEAAARSLLGMAYGGEVDDELETAQGGAITPTGIGTFNTDQLTGPMAGIGNLINILGGLFGGSASQGVADKLGEFFGFAPGTIKLGPSLGEQQLGEGKRQFDVSTEEGKRSRLASLYANPRRILETAFLQSGQQPTAQAAALQQALLPEELSNVRGQADVPYNYQLGSRPPTMRTGGQISSIADILQKRLHKAARGGLVRAASGKVIAGPAVILVGEGKNDEGVAMGTHEYILAPPGTVVAPGKRGELPTMQAARKALSKQMEKSAGGANARVSGQPHRAQLGAITAPTPIGTGPAGATGTMPRKRTAIDALKLLRSGGSQFDVTNILRESAGLQPAATPSGLGTLLTPAKTQFKRGSLFNPLGGASKQLLEQFGGGVPNLRELNNLSGTQRGLFEAALSGEGIDPEDVYEFARRGQEGFQASVAPGQRARLGRSFSR